MSLKNIKSVTEFSKSDTAATVALAAVLLLAILFSAFTIVHVEYVPEWKEEAEYAHMNEVLGDMGQLKSNIDSLTVFMKTVNKTETGSNGALAGGESSISAPISMGGGELPIIGPVKSGGTLSLKNNWGMMEIFTEKEGFMDIDCGSITYYSQNNYYIDQSFCYENGALILSQDGVSIMKLNPSLLNFKKLNGSRMDVYINTINITGENESFSGNLNGGIKLSAERIDLKDPINVTDSGFSFTICTDYPAAWEKYLKATAKKADLKEEEEDYEIEVEPENNLVRFTFKNSSMLRDLYICDTIVGSELQNGGQNTDVEVTGDTGTTDEKPIARFKANRNSGTAPFTVKFTDFSKNSPTSWNWNFGDGTPWFNTTDLSEKSPTHTFNNAGIYSVSLIVSNENGTDSEIKKNYITVLEGALPLMELNHWYTFPYVSGPDSTKPGIIEKLRWPAGNADLSAYTRGVDKLLSGYSSDGNTLYHCFGDDNNLDLSFDFADDYSGFNGTPSYATIRMVYRIRSNLNSGSIVVAGEDLKNLNPEQGYAWHKWYLFNRTVEVQNLDEVSDLVFDLSLYATDSGNREIEIDYLAVKVSDTCGGGGDSGDIPEEALKANFSADPTSGPAPLEVQFTDSSTGNPTEWAWDFGDGTPNSTEQNPVHTYTSAGTYTASLTVGYSGDSSIRTKTITVNESSTAGYGNRIILRKENKGSIIPSGTYIEFKNNNKDSYIIYRDNKNKEKRINLNKNDWIKLVMNGNQYAGEADMNGNAITKYEFNVIIMRNGKEFGRGKIETIWIGKYSNFNSNLKYNIPSYTSETSLKVNGKELISSYPDNNSKINLSNIGPYPTNAFLRMDFNPQYTYIDCSGNYEIRR